MVERTSPYRTLGDIPYLTWKNLIEDAGGDASLASEETYNAARPHSALAAGLMEQESSFGTEIGRNNPPVTKNPFSFRIPSYEFEDDVRGYVRFDSWSDAMKHLHGRVVDGSYWRGLGKRDPYRDAITIEQLENTYAPPNAGNDTETIIEEIVKNLTQWLQGQPAPDPGTGQIRTGRVPHPPHRKEIASKPAPGYGYDLVLPRQNVGMCWHEWQGYYIAGFFSCPSGERCRNALVDYAILKDGTIIMLNDPRGTRAPWANGGGVTEGGMEGDGIPFVGKFGVGAVNSRIVSVEIVKLDGEQYTGAQIQAAGALGAYWHDQDAQFWHEHPYTAKYALVVSFLHFEFGTTNCGEGELDDVRQVQAATKGILKGYQIDVGTDPIPPYVPPQPDPAIPGGISEADAKSRFGELVRHEYGKRSRGGIGFDRRGMISMAWAHRAAKEQVWPRGEDWYVLEDSGKLFQIITFSNDWRLVQVDERAGWQWMDFIPLDV